MTINDQIEEKLSEFARLNGKGNITSANLIMIDIVRLLMPKKTKLISDTKEKQILLEIPEEESNLQTTSSSDATFQNTELGLKTPKKTVKSKVSNGKIKKITKVK